MQQPKLSFTQRMVLKLFPTSWSSSIEAESREWIATCPCGHRTSVWELGGIRWKASGEPSRKFQCSGCHQVTWHKIQREKPANAGIQG